MNKEYSVRGKIVTLHHEFTLKEAEFCLCEVDDWFEVYRKKELKPIEESNYWKRKTQLQKEIDDLQDTKEKEIKDIQNKAIKGLETRLKLNSAFSEDSKMSQIGLYLATELNKMITK